MKRGYFGYGLVLFVATVCAAQAVACTSDFSSCQASRSCPPSDTGGAGDSGDSSSGGSTGGSGGKGGASAGNAGANGVGIGGAGGAGGEGEAGPSGDSGEAGLGGAGGEAGSPLVAPALFGACSLKGEVVCQEHAGAQRLACDGVSWQAGTTCAAGQLCNSLDGQCANKVLECASAVPGVVVCRGDKLLTCGPDLVTASEGITCDGVCKSGVCQAPACGDKKLEAGEECDDGDATNTGACVKCKTATCGDGGVFAGHEQCDDKNTLPGDGCSATCRAEPVALALGSGSTCVLSSTGVVKCWGWNGHGALGLGDTLNRGDSLNELPSLLPAVDLGANRKAVAISAGYDSTCALLDDGTVKCWGANETGQLGTGDTADRGDSAGEMGDALKPIALGTGRTATLVSMAFEHACAVLDNGGVKCWGYGKAGKLGQENTTDYYDPGPLAPIKLGRAAKLISASDYQTCALLDNGSAKCWGSINYVSAPPSADLDSSSFIGDFAGEMSNLPVLNWGAGRTASVIGGGAVTCAILNDATLKCWGSGYDGQIGQPGVRLGGTPDELAALNAVNVGTGRTVKSVSVAYDHVCAVLDNGQLKCWGYNGNGQLGLGSSTGRGGDVGDMGDNLPPVNLGGRTAHQVGTGGGHTCAILDNGTLKCWGANESGQLGLGDTQTRGNTEGPLVPNPTVDLSF